MTSSRLGIVIVTRSRPLAPDYHAYSGLLVERAVRSASAAGWDVDVIAADEGAASTLALTQPADALVILGGEDIAPEFYGADRGYRAEGAHRERADEAQLAVADRAIRAGTPLLGVCRGHQIINVALGGDLVQDLGEGSGHRNERVAVERVMADHAVTVDGSSRFLTALGSTAETRSAHHQAVATLGTGLRVVAVAPDGLVEAIEHESAPVLGVQWHPEDPGAPIGQFAALLASVAGSARRGAAFATAA